MVLGTLFSAANKPRALVIDTLEATVVYGLTAIFLVQSVLEDPGSRELEKSIQMTQNCAIIFASLSIPVAIVYSQLNDVPSLAAPPIR